MSELLASLDIPSPLGLDDLGGSWDAAIYEGCRRFAELGDDAKHEIREKIDRDRSWAIVSWAEGMASLAVREQDGNRLVYGLVGLSLFSHTDFDPRDAIVVYPLFVRAAQLIGEDPDEVTRAAAGLSDSAGRGWLLGLLPADRHDGASMHEEVGAGREFAFRRRDVPPH
jgi:hypothetical protein